MAFVSLFYGSYCFGEEVVSRLSEQLGYEVINDSLTKEASKQYGVSLEKLQRTVVGSLPLFNRFTREREKNIAYLKEVLSKHIVSDNKILNGYATHLLPRNISHILRVCLIANHDYRVRQAFKATGKSEKEAERLIHKDDKDRLQWTQYLYDKLPYDESLYDVVIPMHKTSVEEAVKMIKDLAEKEPVKTTQQSLNCAEGNILSAKVNVKLVEAGHDVDVFSENGYVTITINKYVVRLEQYQEELKKIASEVKGVLQLKTRIGPKYTAPSILPMGEFEMPSKILLVDDEKEFVHTLSERLETRNLESSVVYDGEQALDFVKKDEPDVMVLDLKMPGIDGIEVLRRVKHDHPNIEVIILTGHGSIHEEEIANDLGAFAYLHKPVDIEVLAHAMKEAYKKVNETRNLIKGK